MKLWKWIIEVRVRRLPDKERIGYLARRLSDELRAQGYDVHANVPGYDNWPLSFDVRCGPGETTISVRSILQHWEINTGVKAE